MGEREINGEATIEIIVPDKIKRTEEMGIQGGPTMSRTVVLNGTEYWEDTTNRGGNFMRFGGPGGPGGSGRWRSADSRASCSGTSWCGWRARTPR